MAKKNKHLCLSIITSYCGYYLIDTQCLPSYTSFRQKAVLIYIFRRFQMSNILLVGNGAREHAIAETILRSKQNPGLFAFMKANNPGIASLSPKTIQGSYSDLAR